MVCSNCGFILSEKEEETGPSFSSTDGGAPQITSGPPTSIAQPDMGLETVIGRTGRDARGSELSRRTKSSVDRMRVWDRRSQPNQSAYRSMSKAFDEIKTIAAKLSVGEAAIERAAYIYRKAIEKHLTRGRSIDQLSAAALYAACRDLQIPRSLKDVAASENLPASYASAWQLPATAVQAYPHIDKEGTPAMAPANPADPNQLAPAKKQAPAAAK